MSKNRKKVFPKPIPRLNSKTALELGKNSNKMTEYYQVAIYATDDAVKKTLSPREEAILVSLRKTLKKLSSR